MLVHESGRTNIKAELEWNMARSDASSCDGVVRYAGYTRMVNWRQSASAVVLVVLAAVPVLSTLCSAGCDSPAEAVSAHHGSGANCAEASRSSGDPAIAPLPHDCAVHTAAAEVATMPVQRSHLSAAPGPLAAAIVETTFNPVVSVVSAIHCASPPGSAPASTIPLVLRV